MDASVGEDDARQGPVLLIRDAFVADLRKKDGSELSGRSKRIQKAALDKLLPWFGETPMCDITEEFVNEWYAKACDEVRPSALEHAVWLLKRVMRAATERQPDTGVRHYCPRIHAISSRGRDRPKDASRRR